MVGAGLLEMKVWMTGEDGRLVEEGAGGELI